MRMPTNIVGVYEVPCVNGTQAFQHIFVIYVKLIEKLFLLV